MVRRVKKMQDILGEISGIARYVPPLGAADRESILREAVDEGRAAAQRDRDRTPPSTRAFEEAAAQEHARMQSMVDDLSNNGRQRIAAGVKEQDVALDDVYAIYHDLPKASSPIDIDGGPFQLPIDNAESEVANWRLETRSNADKEARLTDNALMARNAVGKEIHRNESMGTDTPLTTIAIIILSVVVEIVINGWFFLSATERGLVGAVAEVLLFAPLNIGLAVVFGLFSLRYRSSRQGQIVRVAAIVSFFVIPIAIIALNVVLAIARISFSSEVRDILSVHGADRASLAEVVSLLLSPRVSEVVSLEAIAIFLLAIGLATYAAYKAYYLFDPEPGFSTLCLVYQGRKRSYEMLRTRCANELNGIFEDLRSSLDEQRDSFFDIGGRYRVLEEAIEEEYLYYEERMVEIEGFYNVVSSRFHESYGSSGMIDISSLPGMKPLDFWMVASAETEDEKRRRRKDVTAALDTINTFEQNLLERLTLWHQELVEELDDEIFVHRFH